MYSDIPPNETYRGFRIRHGDTPDVPGGTRSVLVEDKRLFPDGATVMETTDGQYYDRMEPPKNDYERLMLRKQWCEIKLAEETKAFNDFKQYCTEGPNGWNPYINIPRPGPGNNAAEQLEHGKLRIAELMETLADITEEITQTPEWQEQRRQERENGEYRAMKETIMQQRQSKIQDALRQ